MLNLETEYLRTFQNCMLISSSVSVVVCVMARCATAGNITVCIKRAFIWLISVSEETNISIHL